MLPIVIPTAGALVATRPRIPAPLLAAVALATALAVPVGARAQWRPAPVLTRMGDEGPSGPLDIDRGAEGLWQKLLKLRTTASVLYTTAHPDDEESGVLTLLSRGMGARTALLTLNRGEGGANALGPELFDALGLVRTEELRLAGRWYGLDDQYFTTAVDYGFSKTLDEAFRSWDREAVLGDMVRAIRMNRPLVVISRWHGSARDGHGHHQAAGVLTPLAVEAAADPARFPEQLTHEGLRPWRVMKLYRGRLRNGEPWHVSLDPGVTSPWLGRTYQEIGAHGLSLQRSQTGGRERSFGGASEARYERLYPDDGAPREDGLFDGLDTSLPGIFALLGEEPPAGAVERLRAADAEIQAAVASFRMDGRGGVATHLAAALGALREAERATPSSSQAAFHLAVKERQLVAALGAALGVGVRAVATPAGTAADTPMGPVVPGQEVDVHVRVTNGGSGEVRLVGANLASTSGWRGEGGVDTGPLAAGASAEGTFRVRIPVDAAPSGPWFFRRSISENAYQVRDSADLLLAESRPRLVAAVTLAVDGVPVTLTREVRTLEVDAPWGTERRELVVAPRLSVRMEPDVHVLRTGDGAPFDVRVEVTSADPAPLDASCSLDVPGGWAAAPTEAPLRFEGPGQSRSATFSVRPAGGGTTDAGEAEPWTISAAARVTTGADPTAYREGYETIRHRDLETRYLYRPARLTVVPVDVAVASDLSVGYVMGVGDAVPAAIEELGARVTLLGAAALAAGDLSEYDAIVVGTRAYAVRPDLVAATPRLLAWARGGGNLVVLYQTPEFTPETEAPLPATLPGDAEETSEEDAPVALLAPEPSPAHDPEPHRGGRLRRVDRAARVEVLRHLGRRLHGARRDARYRPGAAAGRVALGRGRLRPLDVRGPGAPPAAPLRRCRGLSDPGQPDLAGTLSRCSSSRPIGWWSPCTASSRSPSASGSAGARDAASRSTSWPAARCRGGSPERRSRRRGSPPTHRSPPPRSCASAASSRTGCGGTRQPGSCFSSSSTRSSGGARRSSPTPSSSSCATPAGPPRRCAASARCTRGC